MPFIFESHKVLNELRNDTDFLTVPLEFTSTVKANVGEKIKIISKFRAAWELIASPTLNADILTVTSVSGGLRITSSSQDFGRKKFRDGDTFDFIDNSGVTHFGETIRFVQGNIIEVLDTAAPTIPITTYPDAEVRGTTDLNTLGFNYNFPASSNSDNLISALFGLIPTFDFSSILIAGGDITGEPRSPLYWVSGGMVARRLATVNTYEQVYEVELTVVIPFFLQGEFNNLVTKVRPFPFSVETQFYNEEIELSKDNDSVTIRPFKIDRPVNDTIEWFNSNLNGGAESYSVVSIDYEENVSGDERDMPEVTEVTKVTTVIASTGVAFTATDPIVLAFSYLPTELASKSPTGTFDDNWIYESLRTEIGAGTTSGTIIKDLVVVLDNPNQITVTHTLTFSPTQQGLMKNAGQFVSWATMADPSLTPEITNRENLIIDANTVTKNSDISGLLTVIEDDIYYHPDEFNEGVTEGFTNLEEWNEGGIMRDIIFDMKTEVGQLIRLNSLFVQIIAYNPTTKDSFVIQSVSVPTTLLAISTSTAGTQVHEMFSNTTRGLLLPEDSIFNLLKIRNTTFSDPFQRYRMQVGMVLNWEFYRALRNAAQEFFNNTEPNDGLNLDTAHYSGVNGFEIRTAIVFNVQANNGEQDVVTPYRSLSEVGDVFDFGTNSAYTKTFVYRDENDDVLAKVGEKGFIPNNADTKVIITWDDTITKISSSSFEAIVTLELKEQATERNIHRISSVEGVITGDILKPLLGETLLKKSIVAGNFTAECLIDGSLGSLADYNISAELYDDMNESLLFDGTNERVNHGVFSGLTFARTEAFSIEFWVHLNGTGIFQIIASNQVPMPSTAGFYTAVTASDKVQFYLQGDTAPVNRIQVETTSATLSLSTWTHVAITKSTSAAASGMTIYIDGVSQSLTTIFDSLSIDPAVDDMTFGARERTVFQNFLDANLKGAAFWDKELSGAEVTESYNSGCPKNLNTHTSAFNLVSWFPIDGDVIAQITDQASGGTNDGTPVNMDSSNITKTAPSPC